MIPKAMRPDENKEEQNTKAKNTKNRKGLRKEFTILQEEELGNQPRVLRKCSKQSRRKPGERIT